MRKPKIVQTIDAFKAFTPAFIISEGTGGPVRATTTLSFQSFQTGFEFFHYGYASAIAYVMVIVAAIGVTILFRFVRVRREDTI